MLIKDVHWSILQVRLPSMDGRVALVPWADMLNHSPEVPHFILFYKEPSPIVLKFCLSILIPRFSILNSHVFLTLQCCLDLLLND